jgi:hypothetical protein
LASSPLRPTTREIFFQLNFRSTSPYVTSSLTRWVCLLRICLAFYQVYISHIYHIIDNSSIYTSAIKEVKVKVMLRPTISRPVYLGMKHPSGAYDQIYITVRHLRFFFIWGALPNGRTYLSFARVTVSSNKSVVGMYNLHFTCY